MKFRRVFTKKGESPYQGMKFEKRTSEIKELDGKATNTLEVTVPKLWSEVASDILAQKYLRKSGVPQKDQNGKVIKDEKGRAVLGGETDARQVFDRLSHCWRDWGESTMK